MWDQKSFFAFKISLADFLLTFSASKPLKSLLSVFDVLISAWGSHGLPDSHDSMILGQASPVAHLIGFKIVVLRIFLFSAQETLPEEQHDAVEESTEVIRSIKGLFRIQINVTKNLELDVKMLLDPINFYVQLRKRELL